MAQRVMRIGLYGCNMYRTRDLAGPRTARALQDRGLLRHRQGQAEAAAALYGDGYAGGALPRPRTDVVVISTPPPSGALRPDGGRRQDVYLEKPVCVDDEGRALLIETARKRLVRCPVGTPTSIHPFLPWRNPCAGGCRAAPQRLDHWLSPGGAVPERRRPEPAPRMDQGGGSSSTTAATSSAGAGGSGR